MNTRVRRTIATVVSAVAIVALQAASSSSLGTATSARLASFKNTGTVPITPTTIACDTFATAAPTGANLSGRPVQPPATCGTATWALQRGTWTITSGLLSSTTNRAVATVSIGSVGVSAQAKLQLTTTDANFGGVVIDFNASTRNYLIGALSGTGTLQLQLSQNLGNPTVLASSTATVTGSDVLRITRSGTTITVSVNGTIRITYTLTTSDQTNLSGGTLPGLSRGTNSTVKFVNFQATTPVAP